MNRRPVGDEMKEFQEFQEWKLWKARGEKEETASSASSEAKSEFRVRKIDYESFLRFFMTSIAPRQGNFKELFWHFKRLYQTNPTDFKLTGELHADADGSNYISFAYKFGTPSQVNFHCHGNIQGDGGRQRFMAESLDIFINREEYIDAGVFYA